jgi:hypothetical protein
MSSKREIFCKYESNYFYANIIINDFHILSRCMHEHVGFVL